MEFTIKEIEILIKTLNSVPFQGIETMEAVISVKNKLDKYLKDSKFIK